MRFLKFSEVCRKTNASKSWIEGQIGAGKFPAPIIFGPRKRLFIESEIDQYIAAHLAARRPGVATTTAVVQA